MLAVNAHAPAWLSADALAHVHQDVTVVTVEAPTRPVVE